MDMQTAIRTVFTKYVVFSARAARFELWYWVLFSLIPIIGNLIPLCWYIKAGTEGDNEFGPPAVTTA